MNVLTYEQLKAKVQTFSEDAYDVKTKSTSLVFAANKTMYYPTSDTGQVSLSGTLTDWAFQQIAGRLDAPPVRWLGDENHCPTDLQVSILNRLSQEREQEGLLVRGKGDTIRAILSDEYTPFDHKDLIDLMGNAIETMGIEPQVHRAEIGDEMRAYILVPQISFGEDPGGQASPFGTGGLHPAVYISNSERGGGSVRIVGAVFRSVCQNGMIHGWNTQDVFSVRHRWISTGVMRSLVADATATALKMSERAAKLFVASQEIHLEQKSLKPLINEWANKYGLLVGTKESWLSTAAIEARNYGRATDPRLFDVVNAATYVAQQQSPAEREVMERMAGDLLSTRSNPWSTARRI